ncbi:MAG: hypothetical protein K0U41_03740 [Gammaproteobacteria bacterium]|nr:hypothetical protein [Gammaproteobacteria bacterium]
MPKQSTDKLNHIDPAPTVKEIMDKARKGEKKPKTIVNPRPRLTPKSRKKKPGPYDGYTREELIDMLKKKKVPRGPVKPRDVKTVASAVATQAGSSPKARAKAKSLLKGGTSYETEII